MKVSESRVADELIEIIFDELAVSIRDNARFAAGKTLQGPLYGELNILFFHGDAQFMVHHVAGESIDEGNQEQERTQNVHIRNDDVPLFVRAVGLGIPKALSFVIFRYVLIAFDTCP